MGKFKYITSSFLVMLLLLITLLIPSMAVAARIEGTVYDFSLNKAINSRVEINTTPKQVYIARDATYGFNVPLGFYEINSTRRIGGEESYAQEQVTIRDSGNYVLDIILFPISENLDDAVEMDSSVIDGIQKFTFNLVVYSVIGISALFILSILTMIYFKKFNTNKFLKASSPSGESISEPENQQMQNNSKYESNEAEQLISIIGEAGGRITQKEIRKKMPYSEAKVSLMIAELESLGKIKKIKKGRGNIIILNNQKIQ